MKSWKNIAFALSIFGWCGCAHLATVKTTQPRIPATAASEDQLKIAKQHLVTQLQPFDPARTPVILVHGLQETGARWAPMIA